MTTERYACDKGGFTIVWEIENFSHCLVGNGSSMDSPEIKIPQYSGRWNVRFYPRGKRFGTMVECDLRKYYGDSRESIDCLMCVCTSKGEIIYKNEVVNLEYSVNRDEQRNVAKFERNLFERLPDDTLVIHCHTWYNNSDRCEAPVICFVRKPVDVQRKVFYWKMEKFSTLQLREEKVFALPSLMENKPSLTFTLSLVGTNVDDASVQISLKIEGFNSETFISCALYVVGPNGTTKKYMRDEYKFNSGTHFKMFPYFLQRRELITEDLLDDTLTIRGEVSFSGDFQSVDYVMHGVRVREAIAARNATDPESTENPPSALSADMLALYEGSGPPSDFELRAGGRSFPVHQLVLGARSTVFRAMFDNDMLEKSTQGVELTDLDADTAERLLKFAYADLEPPAGLSCESLTGLYAAADKYQILALRKICARRLVRALDPAVAPGILQLADLHRDPHLKEEVIDFIFKRGRAALESDQWKNLEQNDPQLALDTLHRIFCEKVLVQPLEFRNQTQ